MSKKRYVGVLYYKNGEKALLFTADSPTQALRCVYDEAHTCYPYPTQDGEEMGKWSVDAKVCRREELKSLKRLRVGEQYRDFSVDFNECDAEEIAVFCMASSTSRKRGDAINLDDQDGD